MPRDESDERAERDLLESIRQREVVAEALRFATPDKVAAGQALVRMLDAEIEKAEAAMAKVQEESGKLVKAYAKRRKAELDMLEAVYLLEDHVRHDPPAYEHWTLTRDGLLETLQADAEKRGIPNDDH